MGQLPLVLRQAGAHDFEAVHGLLLEASRWLRTKGTDQWAAPWPDWDGRNQRIQRAIGARRTWIAWDGERPAATITASPNDHRIWPPENVRDPAVYVRRLVVGRAYSGQGLGSGLLDWAGFRARRNYGAHWIRVDVWTTNSGLHDYYRRQGFEFCGFCTTIRDYPSRALFQKQTDRIKLPAVPLFREDATFPLAQ